MRTQDSYSRPGYRRKGEGLLTGLFSVLARIFRFLEISGFGRTVIFPESSLSSVFGRDIQIEGKFTEKREYSPVGGFGLWIARTGQLAAPARTGEERQITD